MRSILGDTTNKSARTALKPLLYFFINLFSVNDTKYPNLLTHNFEDDPIIPNPQLPITSERFSQGFAIEMRCYLQPAFNGILYAGSELRIKKGNINGFDIRMVSEFKWHCYQTSWCFNAFVLTNVRSLFSANTESALSSSISSASFTRSRTFNERETPSLLASCSMVR